MWPSSSLASSSTAAAAGTRMKRPRRRTRDRKCAGQGAPWEEAEGNRHPNSLGTPTQHPRRRWCFSRTWGMSSSPTSRADLSPALVPHTLISSRPSCGKARVSSAYQWSILVRSHCAPLKQACSTESLCRSWVGMTAGPLYPRPLTAMRVNLLFFLHCPLGTELLTKSLERSGQKFPEREKTKITTGMMTGGAQGIAL